MAKLRVVVPVYNVEKYIRRCVDSILEQTYTDFQLVLVDDGSLDGCGAICDEYAAKDGRVAVIHQENAGLSAARNAGIYYCQCSEDYEWITFVDSDDMIHPQMLELLYRAVERNNADIGLCAAVESVTVPPDFKEHKQPSVKCHDVNEAYIMDLYYNGKHRYWTAWAKIMRKSLAEEMPFERGLLYEDNHLIFKWLCSVKRIADVDSELYYYAVNSQGISKKRFTIRNLDYPRALRKQARYYAEIKYEKMRSILSTRYIKDGTSMYAKVRDELQIKAEAKACRQRILGFWITNRRCINLSEDEKRCCLSILAPGMMRVYWYGVAIANTIRAEGPVGLVRKLAKKIVGCGKK